MKEEDAEGIDANRKDRRDAEYANELVPVRTLAAWIDDATAEALEACDDAMMMPGACPNNTREILDAGYRLYHSPGYKSFALPTVDCERCSQEADRSNVETKSGTESLCNACYAAVEANGLLVNPVEKPMPENA